LFSRVSLGRVSQVIVDQVRMLITDGRLRAGDRLPSERELCERFGVSRVTVREALRVLEAGGLVEIRVGARGGAFVTTPTSARIGEGLADLLRLSPLTLADMAEARLALECGIVPLVVERATPDDIVDLESICARQLAAIGDEASYGALAMEFHLRVAACTHNPALVVLLQTLHGPLRTSTPDASSVAASDAGTVAGTNGDEHQRFVDAVKRRDVDAAAAIVREHLRSTPDPLPRASA
jgi:DNA-binding FadR family transcriptional regulator